MRIAPITLLVALTPLAAQNTSWFNFENRADLALATDPGGNVIAFGGDRGSPTSLLDDTWALTPNAGWGPRNPGSGPTARSGHALGFHSGGGPTPPRTILFGGSTSATAVSAQTWVYNGNNWSLLLPVNTPPARSGHGIASDIGRNVVLMFGGSGAASNLNDTWEWIGTNWIRRGLSGPSPSTRSGHAMVWSEDTGRVLMFGGNPALSETWEFDDAADAWVQRVTAPGNTPPGRSAAALAYDRFNRNVVLFGGRDAGGNVLNDTWVWDPLLAPNGGWRQRVPGFNPPARSGHSMAYDSTAQRVVLVGGVDSTQNTLENTYEWDGIIWSQRTFRPAARWTAPMAWDRERRVAILFGGEGRDDTWKLSSAGWSELSPAVKPPPRGHHAMGYDAARRRVVIFGGFAGGSSPYLQDTWEWDGINWSLNPTAASPPAVADPAMVYEESRQRLLLFGGGFPVARTFSNQTWAYDGTNWTQLFPNASPPARMAHGMTYDRRRARVVLFGGDNTSPLNDTWEWDGTTWQQANPATPPPARICHLAWSEARGRTLLFGVGSTTADTWEWDGTDWRLLSPLVSPIAREMGSLAYDEQDEVAYLWGGVRANAHLTDTWHHQSLLPARYRTRDAQNQLYGPGCPGSAGTPTLRVGVGERPWLGDTFTVYLSNVPTNPLAALGMGASQLVPAIPLGFLGMGSCLLHTNPIVFLPVSPSGTVTLTVPTDPGLVQSRFFQQAFVFDPPANQLGLTASDLAEATIGVR